MIECLFRYNHSDPTMGNPLLDSDTDEKVAPDKEHWHENQDYIFQNLRPEFEDVQEASSQQNFDWVSHTASYYTEDIIAEAAKWQAAVSHAPSSRPPVNIKTSTLNADQMFIYNAVLEHDVRWRARSPSNVAEPFIAMVNGTAGSGKTYLIKALQQHLGERVATAAPTGVAADNIGGCTYHTLLKIPCWGDLWRKNIISKKTMQHFITLFRQSSTPYEYIIFDEMSMIGKRQLGQIDHMLKHATGNLSQMFGGLNIIFLGDHGQLPPVKDEKAYGWDKVRYKKTSAKCRCVEGFKCPEEHKGAYVKGVKHWHMQGLEAYEHILNAGHIFFLKNIERCSGSSSRHEKFREVQLAIRAGTADETHHQWLWQNCSQAAAEERGEWGEFATATRLVCTRRMRDTVNAQAAKELLDAGVPSLVVQATDTDNRIKSIAGSDKCDSVRFLTTLTLCVGMELMVNKNLCVKHGLVNGTRGKLHDIIVNKHGLPVAVLLLVAQRSSSSSGYSGPEWGHGSARGDVPSGHCLVAIPQHTETVVLDEFGEHTRTQFPLMPAAALTVHKAQGLTLDKVVFDPGDNEPKNGVGSLFVGLTRVKDPHDLVLVRGKGFPNVERLLQMNNYDSLIARHNQEVTLWNAFLSTCKKLAHLEPGPAKKAAPPKFRAKSKTSAKANSKEENVNQKGQTKQDKGVWAWATQPPADQPQYRGAASKGGDVACGIDVESTQHKQKKQRTDASGPRPQRQRQSGHVDYNMGVVVGEGMAWPLGAVVGQYHSSAPLWAHQSMLQGAQLNFRVSDFYSQPEASNAGQVVEFLRAMFPNSQHQFDTPSSPNCVHQKGVSCGMVAATAVALMEAAKDLWWATCLRNTTSWEVVELSNAMLGRWAEDGSMSRDTWLVTSLDIEKLLEISVGRSMASLKDRIIIASYDQCLAMLVQKLKDAALMPGVTLPPCFIISNTQTSVEAGAHWFTVAFQLTWPQATVQVADAEGVT